nr:reverse transcriptase domain-containing protein [Tanacetum cinerariifolium]
MADNRTMVELLQAPTEGYEDAIVILEIAANNFKLKHGLINLVQNKQFFEYDKEDLHAHIRYFNKITSTMKVPNVPSSSIKLILFLFSLEGATQIWLEKEPPRSILTRDDLVSKFINQFFPPSTMTNLRNEITRFQQRFDESFYEVWDRFNDLLRACPHHGFSKLHQLDKFYNTLNVNDQDSLNSAAGGNFLDKIPRECLKIIESKSKVRQSRAKAVVAKVSTSSYTPAISSEVAELKDLVRVLLLDKKNQSSALTSSPTPTPVNAVEPNYVTCSGTHSYQNCPATNGNIYRDNIQEIDVIDMACEEYSQEVLGFSDTVSSGNPTPFYDPIVSVTSSTLTPFEDNDFLLEEGDILLLKAFLNDDPSPPPLNQRNYMTEVSMELKICEAKTKKSSVDEPLVVELKARPPYLEYAFLEGDDKLPVIIVKDLSLEEKATLIMVLKGLYTSSPTPEMSESKNSRYNQARVPDWDMPFELMCDASDFAIGAVLGQGQDKHFWPIHYASKTMTEAESKYTTTKKEMLAVAFIGPQSIVMPNILSKTATFVNVKVMQKYGVTHRMSTPYHSQTSGQVEVSNRGLKRILERAAGENRASWSDKLDDALWAFQHKAYWALKHSNFDLKTAGDHRKIQINELNELRDHAYENSLIYKEKTKRIHDSKIKNRVFNIGDKVLLFNSRLKIFSGKLKSCWSSPFTISQVFPYGTVELSQPNGPNFKVNGHRIKHYFGEDIPLSVVPDLQTFASDH